MTARRHAVAHVFVDDITSPVLDGPDEHHLVRVLRVRPGEAVTVSDGRGSWRSCVMSDRSKLEPVDGVVHQEMAITRPVTVAFGITKSDKPDLVVQKLTEIGVDHIAPVVLDRSVVRWDDDKISHQHERFRRVSREAAMQSRQVFLPNVHRIAANLDTLLETSLFEDQWGAVALAEPGGTDDLGDVSAAIIGPEGGFSERELALVERRVSLVGGILRAETAAIVAGALLIHARSGS